jgi:host factor-I protein
MAGGSEDLILKKDKKMKQARNLQDTILNIVRKDRIDVTIYLMNGVPLNGRVTSFDNFTILIEVDRRQNLIYKHAVSTIVPQKIITLNDDEEQ